MELREYTSRYGAEGEVNARSIVRYVALSGLANWYKLMGGMTCLVRERVQFLYLHHTFEEEVEPLRRMLQALSQHYRLISYSEAVKRVLTSNIDRPYLCLSIDDGLKNALRFSQILKEFEVPACFFICPSLVGETNYQRLTEYCSLKFGMPPTELLSWDDVQRILKDGHEIGSHTMTHPVLARLSVPQAEDEIYRSREDLTRRLGRVDHFAWPEGRFFHFSATAAKTVFDAGYKSCASAERGCHVPGQPLSERSLCLRRDYFSANWPLNHVLYFMMKNCLTATPQDSRWPSGWSE
ncbi:MAG TPA: polysaccharide deacetylase family protein [Blastocatellia bacterium]|nr:polysaccharide deacetylase family protein [Blastocatellia bacterium]